jgi:hypothetical protein
MKNFGKLLIVAAALLMFMAPSAFADPDSTVKFNGSYAFGNNGVGIPPYGGTLNGQAAEFYCVDFTHDIVSGDSWQAIVTPLTTTANYSSTYLYSDFSGNATETETTYEEFAYLITQEQTPGATQTQIAADQWAIWSVTGGSDPYTGALSASTLLGNALTAVDNGFTAQGWEILTPDNANGSYGQEFLVQSPEPGEMALLGIGLCALFMLKRKEWFGLGVARESSGS